MEFMYFIKENFSSLLVFFVTLVLVYLNTRRKGGIPPGPQCWPVIGNLTSLAGKNVLTSVKQLRNKYGDVCAVYMGSELNIILSGYDVIHDALVKRGSHFSFRPASFVAMQWKNAVITGNGEVWKDLRTFTLGALNELCFRENGKPLEERILVETKELIKVLLSNKGDYDINLPVTLSFANVIYCIVHGHRIGYVDKRFLWYLDVLDNLLKRHLKVRVLKQCLPWLKYFPGDLLKQSSMNKLRTDIKEYFAEITRSNFDNHQPGDENCLIDFWINAKEKREQFYDDVTLSGLCHDLMVAGSETSATTLKWIILAMLKKPSIQKELQEQVDSVLGKERAPSIADRKNLPLVEATILEGLRFRSPAPLAVPHTVTQDTVIKGYLIPKDSTILPNLASVHSDPAIFPEPDEFKPERFLNEDRTKILRAEKLIPFSLGPRSCLGETLARTELFLFLTSLIQNVEFCPPDTEGLPTMEGEVGITYRPKHYKVKITERKY